ncbi:MAG: response regulator [Planctomycetaceae bacterium]|jgi:putative two-component system response regulator|nr:response regulator [Planctomycetaceae bacterium]
MSDEIKKIMLVDDNITNLVNGKNILGKDYDVITIPSGEKLFRMLERTVPDLILLDIEMPGMDGYEVIRRLKADPVTAEIPVIFLTARTNCDDERECRSLVGAADYITKPFLPQELLERVENILQTGP